MSPTRAHLPVLAMLLPLAVAVPVALVTRQTMFLLFALMSPAMVLGGAASDRLRRRRERSDGERSAAAAEAGLQRSLSTALADELTRRRAGHPDAAELARCVTRPTARLWERGAGSADILDLLLGTGRLEAWADRARAGRPGPQHLDDAPVVVPLRDVGAPGSRR